MVGYTLLQKSSQLLLDLFLPPHCLNCKTLGSWLCQRCFDEILPMTDPVCQQCGQTLPTNASPCQPCPAKSTLQSIDGIRAAAYFENNPIRTIIHHLKYQNHRAIAPVLGKMLAEAYQRYSLEADVIIPVPLHPIRLKERGYNQSELLAGQLALLLNLPIDNTCLQRIRWTQPQVGLDIEERQKNVFSAFACQDKALRHQSALLIDDVWTTGSTLDACATALKESGVISVWGLTLAKAGVHSI